MRQGKAQQEFPFAVHTHLWRSPIHFSGPLIEEAKSQQKINFGQVVLGDKSITKLTCTNTSSQPLELSSDTVSPIGPFSILNHLRVVPPGATYPVYVQFCPTGIGIFHEKCTFYTPQTRNRLYFSGQGTWPDLKLEPDHLLKELIDMGEFAVGETKTVEFVLQNNEAFDVEFKVDHHVLDEPPACGPSAFYCTPSRGIIEAGKQANMKLVFTACKTASAFGIFHSKFNILTASSKVVHSLKSPAEGTVKPKQAMDVSIVVDNSKRLERKILGSVSSTFRHKIVCKSDKGDRIECILACVTQKAPEPPSSE